MLDYKDAKRAHRGSFTDEKWMEERERERERENKVECGRETLERWEMCGGR